MLVIILFGSARAVYSGYSLTGFPNLQTSLLLCYLLLNRQRCHPRERLAAAFWSEYPTPDSLKYRLSACSDCLPGFQADTGR